MPHVVSTGDMKSAKSLSEYDCKNKCNDHTDTVIMGGTYPIFDGHGSLNVHIDGNSFSISSSGNHHSVFERRLLPK